MKYYYILCTILLLSIGIINAKEHGKNIFSYEINLENHTDDIFHVTFYPPDLNDSDSIYNFVAFAPGVHQVLDYGRYVKSFFAYDINGNEIPVENVSTNEWKISNPEKVDKIKYDIEDTFDAEVEDHFIYPMSGTGIQDEYIVINTFGVIGYFTSRKSDTIQLDLIYNEDWEIGTALGKDKSGSYFAESYYHLADSPILIGDLSVASTTIGDIEVEAYVYSPIEEINSEEILDLADELLNSAYEFTSFAPVDRYTFLMYFFDPTLGRTNPVFYGAGALEHSYSSTYAYPAVEQVLPYIEGGMAHEFMHILTPLNLRSEIIANFDYSKPTLEDQHLWLYEGLTEWVSNIMQLRNGLIDIDEYMADISQKINFSEEIGSDYSLTRLSAEWFTDEGNKKYADIYQLGALTAGAFDIKLLELSNGKSGLRELYLKLINKYGKDKPFDNETFFDEIVQMTYPEIEDFINDYIKDNKPLNYVKIYGKLGFKYFASRPSEDKTPLFGLGFRHTPEGIIKIVNFSKEHKNFGLELDDIALEIFGVKVNSETLDSVIAIKNDMNVGDKYTIKVQRGDEELEFTGELVKKMDYNIFEVDDNATEEQLYLRKQWSKNLELN